MSTLKTPFKYDFVGSFLRPQALKDAKMSNGQSLNLLKKLQKKFGNKYKFMHANRLRESEINFAFCERELYVGTAPEQKVKSAKSGLNTTFKPLFYKCNF